MCLAVPMKVVSIEGEVAQAEVEGVKYKVALTLTPDVGLGDYVMVHAGFAIEKVNTEEAQETLSLLRQMAQPIEKE